MVQVDTEKWEITEEASKFITGDSGNVLISQNRGVGSTSFVNHKIYAGCDLRWITNGYHGKGIEKSFESINDSTWEVWSIEQIHTKVYSWPNLREIQFVQKWPLDIPQGESCQADIDRVLGSFQCASE